MSGEEVIERVDTVRRKVGHCPACRVYLWADVVVVTTVRAPVWSDNESRPNERAVAAAVAMTVEHSCDVRNWDAT